MSASDKPKKTRIGSQTITEYPDGTKVIEHEGGHKLTTYSDGSMLGELEGGHRTILSSEGDLTLTLNHSSIESVYPMNVLNVISIDTQDNIDSKIKEVTFINGGKLFVAYNTLNGITTLALCNVQRFHINKEGTSIGFDIAEGCRDIKLN